MDAVFRGVVGRKGISADLASHIVMYAFTPPQHCLMQLSINTWHRRGAAKRTGLSLNEETVTEGLLLDLKVHFPGDVMIVPFTKRREARIGADWAWAFVGPDGRCCQGMLVQAKRLDDNDCGYRSLYKGKQMERLIASAKRYRLPPVYTFYNHLIDESRIPPKFCGTLASMRSSCPETWGITLASAIAVQYEKPDTSFDCHRHHSMPLHCLLCSWGSGRQGANGSAGAAAAALSWLFDTNRDTEDSDSDFVLPFEPATELPELFREVERVHQDRELDDQEMIANFRSRFPDLAGVVIVRDREDAELDFAPRTGML